MAQYLLSVHHADADPENPPALPEGLSFEQIVADVGAFNEKLRAGGNWVFAGGLTPGASATTVDATVAGRAPVLTDGPFLESKELLGGFWIVEAADLDEALALAEQGSAACRLVVEVRAFQAEPEAAQAESQAAAAE